MHPRGGASLIFVNAIAPCRSNFCLLYVFLLPSFCHTSRPTVLFSEIIHVKVACCLHQGNSRILFRNESRQREPDFGDAHRPDPSFHAKIRIVGERLAHFVPIKSNLWPNEHNMAALRQRTFKNPLPTDLSAPNHSVTWTLVNHVKRGQRKPALLQARKLPRSLKD